MTAKAFRQIQQWVTLEEAGARLGISARAVLAYVMNHKDSIQTAKFGGRLNMVYWPSLEKHRACRRKRNAGTIHSTV